MRSASSSETFKQRRIFSFARRFLLAGRKIQINFARPRPNVRQNFSGKRQTKALNNFKNLYSIECHLPLSSLILLLKNFSCKKNPLALTKGFFPNEIFSDDESEAEAADSAGNNVCRHGNMAVAAVSADNNVCRRDRVAASAADNGRRRDTSASRNGDCVPTLCGRGVRFRFRG